MEPDSEINDLLSRWEVEAAPDPELRRKVLEEIAIRHRAAAAASEEASFVGWARALAGRPILSGMAAAVFVLVGVGLARFAPESAEQAPEELTLSYRLTIDPLYRVHAMAGAAERGASLGAAAEERFLLESLDWLQSELDLDPAQFERVSALHAAYESAFDDLFIDLLSSYSRYRELDRKRMSDDVIDYIALYDLLQEQKRLKATSNELTAELIDKVYQVVGPAQRERFRRLMEQSYPSVSMSADSSPANQNA